MLLKNLFYSRDVFNLNFYTRDVSSVKEKYYKYPNHEYSFSTLRKDIMYAGIKYAFDQSNDKYLYFAKKLAVTPELYRTYYTAFFTACAAHKKEFGVWEIYNNTELLSAFIRVYGDNMGVCYNFFTVGNLRWSQLNIPDIIHTGIKNNKLDCFRYMLGYHVSHKEFMNQLLKLRRYDMINYYYNVEYHGWISNNCSLNRDIYHYIKQKNKRLAQALFNVSNFYLATIFFLEEIKDGGRKYIVKNRDKILRDCDISSLSNIYSEPKVIEIYKDLFQFSSAYSSELKQNIIRNHIQRSNHGTKEFFFLLQKYIQETNGNEDYKKMTFKKHEKPSICYSCEKNGNVSTIFDTTVKSVDMLHSVLSNVLISLCDEDENIRESVLKKLEKFSN